MGCWGITAFESDAGLDSVDYIRSILPQDGRIELGKIIDALQTDDVWLPDVQDAESHTSPMALAEIVAKFLDHDIDALDYDGDRVAKDKKFAGITSFSASRESIRWLRDYLSDTLKYARKNAEFKGGDGTKWNGWFQEKDWTGWQEHISTLITHLDELLLADENILELVQGQCQENREDREKEGAFLPEDGLTLTFSVIMLYARDSEGKPMQEEIYTGGSIPSRFVPNLPDFRSFVEKCGCDSLIEVDNYAYELEGKSWHRRKASKEEIRKIVRQEFPYNYDSGILHPASHDGPDQFCVREDALYNKKQEEDSTELPVSMYL